MKLNGHSIALKLCGLCLLLLAAHGCARPGVESKRATSSAGGEGAGQQPPPAAAPPETTDPTCCELGRGSEELAEAWRRFTEGGRYRLARRVEMDFPDAARRKLAGDWASASRPFQYAWGRRGFDTDKNHLVVIVVDTTKSGRERFGLVIFSSPGGTNEYRPYWLYRDRDLSRTMISAPSGYLMISEYGADGTTESCDVFWNPKSKRYVCKPMRG